MKDKTAVGHPDDDDERCENCGACKHCGQGGVKYVPMPYPVYPYPYALPYRPYTHPQPLTNPYPGPTWISIPAVSGTNQISGTAFQQTWNSGAGNYNG